MSESLGTREWGGAQRQGAWLHCFVLALNFSKEEVWCLPQVYKDLEKCVLSGEVST